MSKALAAAATSPVVDANESARLRNSYAGRMLRRDRLWRSPHLQRRTVIALIVATIVVNLLWIVGLDRVMQPYHGARSGSRSDRGEHHRAARGIRDSARAATGTGRIQAPAVGGPHRTAADEVDAAAADQRNRSRSTQARIGSAGEPALNLFNADGSLRMPKATTRIGPKPIENPREAGKARWAEIETRGENPLDCKRTRFASAFKRDESLGDKVSRKYLKWIGLADGAGIAERAAQREGPRRGRLRPGRLTRIVRRHNSDLRAACPGRVDR